MIKLKENLKQNRPMKNSPHRLKHEKRKAIRKAQQEESYEATASQMTEAQKKTYLASPRKVKISKAKASSRHKHHMTTPSETESESLHQEGEHWIRTIQKQTLDVAGRLQKKLQKFNFLKRKK